MITHSLALYIITSFGHVACSFFSLCSNFIDDLTRTNSVIVLVEFGAHYCDISLTFVTLRGFFSDILLIGPKELTHSWSSQNNSHSIRCQVLQVKESGRLRICRCALEHLLYCITSTNCRNNMPRFKHNSLSLNLEEYYH